jgi:S-adenosylmethionine decarboxylase
MLYRYLNNPPKTGSGWDDPGALELNHTSAADGLLRTYGKPVIHRTRGQGKAVNEGFDGFVPLIDSGIYIAVWLTPRFLSTILYTCGPFDEERAVALVRDFFSLGEHKAAIF